jgi:hypothetical protein
MAWRKLGHVFSPDGTQPWMRSHAANPFARFLGENRFRIYFTARDEKNRSHVSFIDVELTDGTTRVIQIATEPVLAPGERGLFDDSGVTGCCLLEHNGERYLYYLGWNLGVTVPYRNAIGLAKWHEPEQRFVKHSRAPVIDRSDADPFSISYPFVLQTQNGLVMWYGSNLKWGQKHDDMNFVIKTATSNDGISWKRDNHVAIRHEHENEYAIARPHVLKDNGVFKMWYSFRGNGLVDTYRIGYAESDDGFSWKRLDAKAGIDVSTEGWDADMICYPFIFDHRGKRYMLYNGNGYGKSGFGLAILEDTA